MPILAAPLQEYTTAAFRNAHSSAIGGIIEYYTPFVRLEKSSLAPRSERDLRPENNTAPAVPQILTKNPEEATRLIELLGPLGYTRVDFNFCCPFPKVTRHGYGAALLSSPQNVAAILQVTRLYPAIRFSAKLRLGLESPRDLFDLLPVLNDAGLCQVVLHPRTAAQQYDGTPALDAYREFAEQCASPVFYNGDIRSPAEAAGLENLMLGRGLLADPLLPLRLQKQTPEPSLLQRFHHTYVAECQRLYQQPLLKLKLLWDFFLPETPRRLIKAIQKAHSMEEYADAAAYALDENHASPQKECP